MIVAATNKCNITDYVLTKLGELYYGVKCDKTVDQSILYNYAEYLNCSTVKLQLCEPSDCEAPSFTFTCSLRVVNLIFSQDTETHIYIFSIDPEMIVGGREPYTYNWEYETDDFEVTDGGINSSELHLVLKPDKIFENLVTNVKVTVKDADGCTSEKSCWLANGILKCSANYVPCPNSSNLIITSPFTTCIAPSSLIVSKV